MHHLIFFYIIFFSGFLILHLGFLFSYFPTTGIFISSSFISLYRRYIVRILVDGGGISVYHSRLESCDIAGEHKALSDGSR